MTKLTHAYRRHLLTHTLIEVCRVGIRAEIEEISTKLDEHMAIQPTKTHEDVCLPYFI